MPKLMLVMGGLVALGLAGAAVSIQMANAQVTVKPTGGGAQILTCPAGWVKTASPQGYTCHVDFNVVCEAGQFNNTPTVVKLNNATTWRAQYLCDKP